MSSYDFDESQGSQFTVTMDSSDCDDDADREEGMEGDDTNSEAEEDSEEEDNNNLEGLQMPQRKRKEPAVVWKLADRVEGGELCKKIYTCAQGNTSNIYKHMVSTHRDREEVKMLIKEQTLRKEKLKLKRLQKEKKKLSRNQPLITNFSNRRGILDPLKKKRIDEALVKMSICMNRPFDDVENHHFRNLMFIAEPNYIVPSRRRHVANFDSEAVNVAEALKKDISKDVTEAGHKTINITSDHGTSSDQFRTKKNALTVARCDKNFNIKKDVVKMITCEGSQTGQKIREDVKKWLEQGAGWEPDWTVNWVTDNESKQVNARHPEKHHGVGLPTTYTGLIENFS